MRYWQRLCSRLWLWFWPIRISIALLLLLAALLAWLLWLSLTRPTEIKLRTH